MNNTEITCVVENEEHICKPPGKTIKQCLLKLNACLPYDAKCVPNRNEYTDPCKDRYLTANVPNSQTLEAIQMPISSRMDQQGQPLEQQE